MVSVWNEEEVGILVKIGSVELFCYFWKVFGREHLVVDSTLAAIFK